MANSERPRLPSPLCEHKRTTREKWKEMLKHLKAMRLHSAHVVILLTSPSPAQYFGMSPRQSPHLCHSRCCPRIPSPHPGLASLASAKYCWACSQSSRSCRRCSWTSDPHFWVQFMAWPSRPAAKWPVGRAGVEDNEKHGTNMSSERSQPL